jgi:hypothetical protein
MSDSPENVRFVLVDREEEARRAFETESAYLRDHPLDRCKVPGGYFLNADGEGAHDANGNPLPIRPEDEELAARRRDEIARAAAVRAAAQAPDSWLTPEERVEQDRDAVAAARPPSTRRR